MTETFTQSDLREYLESLPPGETAGLSGRSCDCPISLCLQRKYGTLVRVYLDGAYFVSGNSGDAARIPLDPWAVRFIGSVDNVKGREVEEGLFAAVAITKEKALEILAEVTA